MLLHRIALKKTISFRTWPRPCQYVGHVRTIRIGRLLSNQGTGVRQEKDENSRQGIEELLGRGQVKEDDLTGRESRREASGTKT